MCPKKKEISDLWFNPAFYTVNSPEIEIPVLTWNDILYSDKLQKRTKRILKAKPVKKNPYSKKK